MGVLYGGCTTNTWAAIDDQPVGVAELGERLGDRRRRAEDDDVGRHQRAGGAFLVAQQATHLVGVFVVHRLEDARALLAGHLGQQVGQVVVLHLLEHVDEPLEVEAFDDPQLLGLGQLFEQVGQPLVVHRLGQLLALRQRHRAHDAGHVAGVHVAQARHLGGHLGAGRVEQLGELGDVDQAIARPPAQRAAPREANLGELPPRLAAVATGTHGDIADRLVADLAIDDVAPDQHLAGLWLERVEVDVPAAQAGAVAVDPRQAGGVDEDPPALTGGDEAEHTWSDTGATRNDDDVVEATDGRTTCIEQRQAHDSERVDQLACHVRKATPACLLRRDAIGAINRR